MIAESETRIASCHRCGGRFAWWGLFSDWPPRCPLCKETWRPARSRPRAARRSQWRRPTTRLVERDRYGPRWFRSRRKERS